LQVCLLLVGVVGCEQSESNKEKSESNKPTSDADKVKSKLNKAEAEFNKGIDFAVREDWDTAIACFTEAIRINPDYAKAYYNRGVAYEELGEKAKAATDFAKAKELGEDP
jgi:tetratricopeptide (TPR) repeat protein